MIKAQENNQFDQINKVEMLLNNNANSEPPETVRQS